MAIRDQLARAEGELQRVDYRTLTLTLKDQYDVAKRFIQQSREALMAKNLVYAATLAGKASEIAEVLPRREPLFQAASPLLGVRWRFVNILRLT